MGESSSMKLLLDENLSLRIVPLLQEAFPGTTQVVSVGLERADDRAIWEFAKKHDYVIVTKDDDFLDLLSVIGYPPKVVLLAWGNCSNQQIVEAMMRRKIEIMTMLENDDVGLVELY
jgi:predicted nuclease of predicted toxin-antitoxin system